MTVKMATPAQIERYYSVCMDKRITPKNISAMSQKDASAELQRVFDVPPLATEPQIKTVLALVNELIEMGIERVKPPSDHFLANVRVTQCSDVIRQLKKIKQDNLHLAPPDDAQLDRLVKLQHCMEVPFESIPTTKEERIESPDEYGVMRLINSSIETTKCVDRRIYLDEKIVSADGSKKYLWRWMTADEFRAELRKKLNHSEASRILSQYEGLALKEKRTQLSEYQIKLIRQLENRLATLYVPKPVENLVDFTADSVDYTLDEKVADKSQNWNPESYQPLDEHILKMFTSRQADEYINQLKVEYEQKDLYSAVENAEVVQFTNKNDYESTLRLHRANVLRAYWNSGRGYIEFTSEQTFESVRKAQTYSQWRQQQFTALNNLLFALQSIGGIDTEEFRNEVSHVFFTYTVKTSSGASQAGASREDVKKLKRKIAKFMITLVKDKCIKVRQLGRICENSEIAEKIFLTIVMKNPTVAKMLYLES